MPNDFSFQTVPVTFVNGAATVGAVGLSSAFQTVITNKDYQFQWSIRFAGSTVFQQFKTTTHRLYLMHGLIDNINAQYRITTKRLDYVTGLAKGLSDLAAIASAVIVGLRDRPGKDGSCHIRTPNNVWAALEDPLPGPNCTGLDCESVSAIGAAQLQQLGYGSANVRKAYATGADPLGDTNATTPEIRVAGGLTYTLGFRGNVFEGFIYLSPPDVSSPTAFTALPESAGALGPTGCDVTPDSQDNRIAFRVLTSTYSIMAVPYQEWTFINSSDGSLLTLPDQILLPRRNCPASENP